MLFTENFSAIRRGNHTNENFGIGKVETAYLVEEELKQHSSSAVETVLSENPTVPSR